MRKIFLPAALLASALFTTAASAATQPEHRFTRDGYTYVYAVAQASDAIVLTGTCETTGTPFQLTVKGDWVSGTANGTQVSFRAVDAQARLAATELAAR